MNILISCLGSLIAGVSAIIVCLINNGTEREKFKQEYNNLLAEVQANNRSTQELTLYRINQLEEKQDKHNELIERMFKLEQRVDDLTKGG